MTYLRIHPKQVLLVEPYSDGREVLTLLLESSGYRVKAVRTGEEALASASVQAPDVVLTEIYGLDMDARNFCRRLRELPDMNECRFVALTGYCTELDRKDMLGSYLDAVLLKPSSLNDILSALT